MLKEVSLVIGIIVLAIIVGKVVSKFKLPAILGWLFTGMMVGPYVLGWLDNSIMHSTWYHVLSSISEIMAGLFIGTELIFKDLKKSGKQIMTICVTESLGTFIVVTVVFGIIFKFMDVPVYLAFIFGSIALATAPAPSLSIINEYKAKGPVTSTLMPLAILDDVIALIVFFIITGIIKNLLAGGGTPIYVAPLMILLSIMIGLFIGILASFTLKKKRGNGLTLLLVMFTVLFTTAISMFINESVLPSPMMNLMLIGVAFSTTFSNLISKERLEEIRKSIGIVLLFAMIILIINLGVPLDVHLITGAGIFTAVYIISRAIGKLGGARFGANLSKAPITVKKYLGYTLLPHSGVSLVFTGIAVNTLIGPAPEYAHIIQGTIAAAAVINEVIAVVLAKYGFMKAGELSTIDEDSISSRNTVTVQ